METILGLVPMILPVVIPLLTAVARRWLGEKIPTQYIPMALAVGGAVLGALSSLLGITDATDLTGAGVDAWNGALIGLAGVGIHQVYRKARAPAPV